MTTAFQQSAFQDDAYQIAEGASEQEAEVVIQSGVRKRWRRFDKERHIVLMFPQFAEYLEDKERSRRERKPQSPTFYDQTTPEVELVQFGPLMGMAFDAITYSPDEIPIDRSLDTVAMKSDEKDDEELVRFLAELD